MSNASLRCSDSSFRRHVLREWGLNGIDYVEISDDQEVLTITFLSKAPADLKVENVRIDGGATVTDIKATELRMCSDEDPELDDCVRVTVDRFGDFSSYTLRIVETDVRGRPGTEPFHGFDPRYASIEFSFKAQCPTDVDCNSLEVCPPDIVPEPEISYLAKDYESFRRLILDRLALVIPEWRERHVPDVTIALVESLAYVGDYLSYYQDAVATEAYLGTARRRISVRRHVRLVDYPMHEGCNARAWVAVSVSSETTLDAEDCYFITASVSRNGYSTLALRHDDVQKLPVGTYEVFEPLTPIPPVMYPAHNTIHFWTWGEDECCLPAGTTRATLDDTPSDSRHERDSTRDTSARGHRGLSLKPGDVLILEEILGPRTGSPSDADPAHRQAVRLTRVEQGFDEVLKQPILEVEWAEGDALRFPLCLSTVGPDCRTLRVSVARGNVVLVDHGRTLTHCDDNPEPVPVPPAPLSDPVCDDPCTSSLWNPRARLTQLLRQLLAGDAPTEQELAFIAAVVGPDLAAKWGLPSDTKNNGDKNIKDPPQLAKALEGFLTLQERASKPFTYQLRHGPLTYVTLFPNQDRIAREQARLLSEFEPRTKSWVESLLRRVRQSAPLTRDEVEALRSLFGEGELRLASSVLRVETPPEEIARLMERLLARWPRILEKKIRRLGLLEARCRAGYVLTSADASDLSDAWGEGGISLNPEENLALLGPASEALCQDPRSALAALSLSESTDTTIRWDVRYDLLESSPDDRHLVVEREDDGSAQVRFGDGRLGRDAPPGQTLYASYRIGNGAAGNVGAEVISRIVFCKKYQDSVIQVRNPLPACGGVDPEPIAEAKAFAPVWFRRRRLRAITADDYGSLAAERADLQGASAVLSWTGSWYEVQVAVDPVATNVASDELLRDVDEGLFAYRRIGHDLRVQGARYVQLDIGLDVCILPNHVRGDVANAIRGVLSNRTLADGSRGLFHPDNLTFRGEISLSSIVATVQRVAGVQSVGVTRFERLDEGDHGELDRGVIRLARREIARLDADPGQPANGRLRLNVRGGR